MYWKNQRNKEGKKKHQSVKVSQRSLFADTISQTAFVLFQFDSLII